MKKSELYKLIKKTLKERNENPNLAGKVKKSRAKDINTDPEIKKFNFKNSGLLQQYASDKDFNDELNANPVGEQSMGPGLTGQTIPESYACNNPNLFPNDSTTGLGTSFVSTSTILGGPFDGGFCAHPDNDTGVDYSADPCFPYGPANTNSEELLLGSVVLPAWDCGGQGPTFENLVAWLDWTTEGSGFGNCDYVNNSNTLGFMATYHITAATMFLDQIELYNITNSTQFYATILGGPGVGAEYSCCTEFESNGVACYEEGCPDDGSLGYTGTMNQINPDGWPALNFDAGCENGCDGFTNNYTTFPPDVTVNGLDQVCTYAVPGCIDEGQCYPNADLYPDNPGNTSLTCAGFISPNSWGASNFNSTATYDDGSCEYTGCNDATPGNNPPLDLSSTTGGVMGAEGDYIGNGYAAINYDPTAVNGSQLSCEYITGCMIVGTAGYNIYATIPCNENGEDNDCCGEAIVDGCMDSNYLEYNPNATADPNDECQTLIVEGCTNPNAGNYNSNANVDDGSCDAVLGCTDSEAYNFDPTADTDDGSCIDVIEGCTAVGSSNYNEDANVDDGSCVECIYGCLSPGYYNTYNPIGLNPFNPTCNDESMCIPFTYGCTDPNACNYNAGANTPDDTCYPCDYPPEGFTCNDVCTPGSSIIIQQSCDGYIPSTWPENPDVDCEGLFVGDQTAVCMDLDSIAETGIYPWNYMCDGWEEDATCYCEGENCIQYALNNSFMFSDVPFWCRYAGCRLNANHPNYGQAIGTNQNWAGGQYINGLVAGDDGCPPIGTTEFGLRGENGDAADARVLSVGNLGTEADIAQSLDCCELQVLGCTDSSACNYDSEATDDDGSCTYPDTLCQDNVNSTQYLDCNCNCNNDSDGDGICDEVDDCEGTILACGCDTPYPTGYVSPNSVSYENGPGQPCNCNGDLWDQCLVCGGNGQSCVGCTNENACNYDSEALYPDTTQINGGCVFEDHCGICGGWGNTCIGCTNAAACNYDGSADVSCGLLALTATFATNWGQVCENLAAGGTIGWIYQGLDPNVIFNYCSNNDVEGLHAAVIEITNQAMCDAGCTGESGSPFGFTDCPPEMPNMVSLGNAMSDSDTQYGCIGPEEGYDCEGVPLEEPCVDVTAVQCNPELPEDHPKHTRDFPCVKLANMAGDIYMPNLGNMFLAQGSDIVELEPDEGFGQVPAQGNTPYIWDGNNWPTPQAQAGSGVTIDHDTTNGLVIQGPGGFQYTFYTIDYMINYYGVEPPAFNNVTYPSFDPNNPLGCDDPYSNFGQTPPATANACNLYACNFVPGPNDVSIGSNTLAIQQGEDIISPNACGYPPGVLLYSDDQSIHQQIVILFMCVERSY